MKKVLVFLISFFTVIINVYAADINVTMSGQSNIDAGQTFEITVSLSGNNIWGFNCNLNYDKNKLELVSSTGQNGFTATVGDKIVLDSVSGHDGTFAAVVLKFKGKNEFNPGESTTISLSNGKGATDSNILTSTEASKTLSVNVPKSSNNNLSSITIDGKEVSNFSNSNLVYDLGNTEATSLTIGATTEDKKANMSGTGKKSLDYGNNSFEIVVTAENGSKKTYTVKINRVDNRSSNNNLASLSISSVKINFNKNTTNYTATVENKVTEVTINAKAEDSKATVSGTGSKKLDVYMNTFSVVVTAENGSKKTYTIKINRKDSEGTIAKLSSDNTLKELSIKDYEIKPTFDKNTLEYNLEVANDIDKLEIKAETNDKNANIKINNPKELSIGINKITIEVTSEDGNKKIYTITVNRKKDIQEVTLDKLSETIKTSNSDVISVRIDDSNTKLSNEILNELSNKNKVIEANYYDKDNILLYSWKINGSNLGNVKEIDTKINLNDSDDDIEKITNYAKGIYLDFIHNGKLPNDTSIKLYVGDKYKENDIINIYYYDKENKEIVDVVKDLVVHNGYIEFNIDHCSSYVVTKAIFNDMNIQKENNNYLYMIIILETVLLLVLIGYIIYSKTKLNKKLNVDSNVNNISNNGFQYDNNIPIQNNVINGMNYQNNNINQNNNFN